MPTMFSIITPTLQRDSLIQTCWSLDMQTFTDWEHFVQVDQEEFDLPLHDQIARRSVSCAQEAHIDVKEALIRRRIGKCVSPHGDGGNTCRRSVWPETTGEWIYYLDDDNYLADPRVLADMHSELSRLPENVKMALFPILRLDHIFYSDPPRSCHVDTMNFILRREIAQWPDTNAYGSDGVLIDRLMEEKISYAAFPTFRPIGVLPKISFGKCD